MKAIVTFKADARPEMRVEERPVPPRRPGTSLVRMQAATINQLSNTIRTGGFGNTPVPLVLGNEGAGIVEESETLDKGSRVAIFGGSDLGVTRDGLFQEWVVVDDWRLMPLPDAMSFDEGATLTVNYLTALNALTRTAQVQAGEYALVSGSTGSVGSALVQIGRALDVNVIALVSSAEKAALALQAGAFAAVDWTKEDVTEKVNALTGGKGADHAFDPVGGAIFSKLFDATRPRGRIVSIGFTAGRKAEIDLLSIIASEKVIEGYSLHADTREQSVEALKTLSELAFRGAVRPTIDSSWPTEEFEKGYARLTSREAVGSITVNLK
jgi:NADPH2:quinone reductase